MVENQGKIERLMVKNQGKLKLETLKSNSNRTAVVDK